MTTIASLLGMTPATILPDTAFPLKLGVELEVERPSYNPDKIYRNWDVHADGSLRNGLEFVFRSPKQGDDIPHSINNLFESLDSFATNPRCSTHIHVDATNLSVTNVKALFLLTNVIEDGIYTSTTADRKWCGYAMPLNTMPSQRVSKILGDDLRGFMDGCFQPSRRQERYYGLNFLSLKKFGTIEFRYFQACEDAEQLLEWAHMVTTMIKNIQHITYQQVVEAASDTGLLSNLLKQWLEGYYNKLVSDGNLLQMCDTINELAAMAATNESIQRTTELAFYSPLLSMFLSSQHQFTPAKALAFDSWFKLMRVISVPELMDKVRTLQYESDESTTATSTYTGDTLTSLLAQRSESPLSARRIFAFNPTDVLDDDDDDEEYYESDDYNDSPEVEEF